MKAGRISTTLVLMGLTAAGCAAGPQAIPLTPVTDPSKRFEVPGISVLPPHGEDWLIAAPIGLEVSRIAFSKLPKERLKRLRERSGTIVAQVEAMDIRNMKFEQFIEQIEKETLVSGSQDPESRFRVLERKARPDRSIGQNCARYEATAEDRRVPGFQGIPFIFTIHGLVCLHPHWPRFVILMQYSQRTPPGVQPLDMKGEGEAFLKSLAFTPTQPVAVLSIPVSGGPRGLAVGKGAVWIAQLRRDTVARLNPHYPYSVTMSIPVGTGPVGVAISKDALWVTNMFDGTVSRIDPHTNQVVATIPVGRQPIGVAVGEGAVWVSTPLDGLSRIDPQANRVIATVRVRTGAGVAVGEGSVWVAAGDGTLSRIDPQSNQVIATMKMGKTPYRLAVGEGGVWVANQGSNTISRVSPQTNQVVATIPVGRGPVDVTVSGGFVWVAHQYDDVILRISPQTNKVIGQAVPVGGGAFL